MKSYLLSRIARRFAGLGLFLTLVGCREPAIPELGDIVIEPSRLSPGQEATVSISLRGIRDPKVTWSAPRGGFPNGNEGWQVSYVAPHQAGMVTIGCMVVSRESTYTTNLTVLVDAGGMPPALASPSVPQASQQTGPPSSAPLPNPLDITTFFSPSGLMGDGSTAGVVKRRQSTNNPHSGDDCQEWEYKPSDNGWAAVAWQHPANNFGTRPGKGLSSGNYSQVTFWARGSKGGEQVEFKVGCEHSSLFVEHPQFSVKLTTEWSQYSIPIAGKSLTNVVTGFVWAANVDGNPQGLTFYLDDIMYE